MPKFTLVFGKWAFDSMSKQIFFISRLKSIYLSMCPKTCSKQFAELKKRIDIEIKCRLVPFPQWPQRSLMADVTNK